MVFGALTWVNLDVVTNVLVLGHSHVFLGVGSVGVPHLVCAGENVVVSVNLGHFRLHFCHPPIIFGLVRFGVSLNFNFWMGGIVFGFSNFW